MKLPKLRYRIWPDSKEGLVATILFAFMAVLMFLVGRMPESAVSMDLPSFGQEPLYATLVYGHMVVAIVASVYAFLAMFRRKDRALLVFLSIPYGVLYFFGLLIMAMGLLFR